jgi:molecular chaperone Hsp33
VRGNGPVGFMVADCTNHGRMRGYASFDAAAIATAAADSGLLGEGLIALTVDQTAVGGELQQGIVSLEGRTLTDAMLAYFRVSEQIRTGIKLAIDRDAGSRAWHGGGIILQALPAAPGADEDAAQEAWREAMLLLETATTEELAGPGLDPDTVLYRLFHETGVRVYTAVPLVAGCSCTERRVRTMLGSFPAATLAEMRLPDGRLEVTCQFCNRVYSFDEAALRELTAGRRQ